VEEGKEKGFDWPGEVKGCKAAIIKKRPVGNQLSENMLSGVTRSAVREESNSIKG